MHVFSLSRFLSCTLTSNPKHEKIESDYDNCNANDPSLNQMHIYINLERCGLQSLVLCVCVCMSVRTMLSRIKKSRLANGFLSSETSK